MRPRLIAKLPTLRVVVPDGTDQVGNIGPPAAEAAEESADGVSCVGNIGPQAGKIVPQTVRKQLRLLGEDAKGASGVGNIVPRMVEETKKTESAACASSVGNVVPRGLEKTSTSAEVPLNTSRVDNQVSHSESETPPARPVEEQCHVFDGVSGRQVRAGAVHLEALPEVSALLNLEELSMKDFLAELKVGEIAETVLLKPETSPEDLNSSSVMDEDVLEGFTKQRATRLGYEILKNPEEYSDVVSKHPPSQLPPDRGVRHEIDLVPGTKKWRLVHAYNKLNNATVPTQTPIPRKDVLLNNMSGCTLYSVLDLVDGYYQILMRESDIPLTAVSTLSGMLWECCTYFDDIFVHSRAKDGQTAMEKDLRKWLGLANYLHKYSAGYAELARPLSDLLKKDADWVWERQHQYTFDSIKARLQQAPVLALPDGKKSFSVVCGASDYAIGCALLQKDDEGHEGSSPSSPGS
ncbi:Pol protein [Phytophthora palmivora]|uniref:Pol protein n=1 Tax=Phytophthora palmivora TaxID=4796 RepID=A0A2P4X9I0_9STRA|nr:Pol protein [Phytophthora palmivora]